MFKLFDDDETCPTCNKNMNDLVSGKVFCIPCVEEYTEISAKQSTLRHLGEAGICLFNFDFIGMLCELKWTIERLTGTGDYNKETGDFYTKGYLKK